jgi:predicted DNA-binding transcriptional regulator AlpA
MNPSSRYFVCDRCDAKWFAHLSQSSCPRCQQIMVSNEQLEPPWRKHSSDDSPPKRPAEALNRVRVSLKGIGVTPDTILVTVEQLATLLHVSKRSLWRFQAAGLIPAPVRIRKTIRWRLSDIEDWIVDGCPPMVSGKSRKTDHRVQP